MKSTTNPLDKSKNLNLKFDENNCSQVGEGHLSDVGDEIPPEARRKMGVGQILLVKEPLVVEGGQCSTQVEPLSSQGLKTNQEQDPSPHSSLSRPELPWGGGGSSLHRHLKFLW
jgi:hypothetical protein